MRGGVLAGQFTSLAFGLPALRLRLQGVRADRRRLCVTLIDGRLKKLNQRFSDTTVQCVLLVGVASGDAGYRRTSDGIAPVGALRTE